MISEKFAKLQDRFRELEGQLADNSLMSDQANYQKLAKEYADLNPIVTTIKEYQSVERQLGETKALLASKHDADFEEMAQAELSELKAKLTELEAKFIDLITPKEDQKNRNQIIEIRAGTGGQEASLFAADLYRMYTRYAERKGWKVELMNMHESEAGGFKEVVFTIIGTGAEKALKWESGAHRVQRVPSTEAAGRIHTSAATVVIMSEPEEVDVEIKMDDIRIDVFRASGPGGQSVNTTDSAVRLTHIPSGIVVASQDERSQLKNKAKAFRVLRARILDKYEQDNFAKASKERKAKIGTGDRSEKIRTYNFPDRRVTDHRIGFSTYQLPSVMDGAMDEIVQALIEAEEKLKNETA